MVEDPVTFAPSADDVITSREASERPPSMAFTNLFGSVLCPFAAPSTWYEMESETVAKVIDIIKTPKDIGTNDKSSRVYNIESGCVPDKDKTMPKRINV